MAELLLVGAGHAHLHVARHARRFVDRGIHVTLIDPHVFWYSGLATGMLGGMYEPAEDQVDPQGVIESAGGTFIKDRVIGMNRDRREVMLASGRTLKYDAVSLNTGSRVPMQGIDHAEEFGWPVKPIKRLWELRRLLEQRFSVSTGDAVRVVVVGGGPTGCEVAANINALAWRRGGHVQVTIVTRDEAVAMSLPRRARQRLHRELERRGIRIVPRSGVVRVTPDAVIADDGTEYPADAAVVATGLVASALMSDLGLPTDERGSLCVTSTLQSPEDDRVLGAGDCIRLPGDPLPKLGVFGVRAAPILCHNLLALLTEKPLKSYHPQKKWLSILNLGRKEALATRGRWWWLGRSSLWLKDWLDRRFLDKVRGPSGSAEE